MTPKSGEDYEAYVMRVQRHLDRMSDAAIPVVADQDWRRAVRQHPAWIRWDELSPAQGESEPQWIQRVELEDKEAGKAMFGMDAVKNKNRGRGKLWCLECEATSLKCNCCQKQRLRMKYASGEAKKRDKDKRYVLLCQTCVDDGFTKKDFETYLCSRCLQRKGRTKFNAKQLNNHLSQKSKLVCLQCRQA